MLWITLVLFIVGEAVAQDDRFKTCQLIRSNLQFNRISFAGTWYQFGKDSDSTSKNINPPETTKCVTARYDLIMGAAYKIKKSEIPLRGSKPSITDGTVYSIIDPPFGIFKVTYQLSKDKNIDELIQVVDTDYRNWAVMLDCRSNVKQTNMRIYTRTPHPQNWVLAAAYKAANRDPSDFVQTHQTNCPRVG